MRLAPEDQHRVRALTGLPPARFLPAGADDRLRIDEELAHLAALAPADIGERAAVRPAAARTAGEAMAAPLIC
jgi:hypothetical protein